MSYSLFYNFTSALVLGPACPAGSRPGRGFEAPCPRPPPGGRRRGAPPNPSRRRVGPPTTVFLGSRRRQNRRPLRFFSMAGRESDLQREM
jgi:hypothetical protein